MTSYVTYESSANLALMSMLSAYFGVILFLSMIISVVMLIAYWKLFTKAGLEGWKSLIPIYNFYCIFRLVYGNGWKFLLLLIPFVNLVYVFVLPYKFAKCYDASTAIAVLNIFLPIVALCILAFGDSRYYGTYPYIQQLAYSQALENPHYTNGDY